MPMPLPYEGLILKSASQLHHFIFLSNIGGETL